MQKQIFSLPNQLIRKCIFSGFFHFIHAFITILILLLIGQITGHGESTKSKILQDFTLHIFQAKHQWQWAIGLISLKAIFSFLRNYSIQELQLAIVQTMQYTLLNISENYIFSPKSERQIKQYGRALLKGRIVWWSDITLLLIIFIALFRLHFAVAFAWLFILTSSLIFRKSTLSAFLKGKNSSISSHKKHVEKFKFLMQNKAYLMVNRQWQKDLEIFKKRAALSQSMNTSFAVKKALTTTFFPVYFFGFLFFLTSPIFSNSIESGTLLQLILILLYSQSAMVRCFKAPESWKIIQKIKQHFLSMASTEEAKNKFPWDQFIEIQQKNNSNLVHHPIGQNLREIISNPQLYSSEELTKIAKHFSFFRPQSKLRGETFLSALTNNKETDTLKVIHAIIKNWKDQTWQAFPWKSKIQEVDLNPEQLAKLHLLKTLCHPAEMVVIESEILQSFDINKRQWLMNEFDLNNKKIILI